MQKFITSTSLLILLSTISWGQNAVALKAKIAQKAETLEAKVVAWRRDLHQNPELGNREFKTAEKVAAHFVKNTGGSIIEDHEIAAAQRRMRAL